MKNENTLQIKTRILSSFFGALFGLALSVSGVLLLLMDGNPMNIIAISIIFLLLGLFIFVSYLKILITGKVIISISEKGIFVPMLFSGLLKWDNISKFNTLAIETGLSHVVINSKNDVEIKMNEWQKAVSEINVNTIGEALVFNLVGTGISTESFCDFLNKILSLSKEEKIKKIQNFRAKG